MKRNSLRGHKCWKFEFLNMYATSVGEPRCYVAGGEARPHQCTLTSCIGYCSQHDHQNETRHQIKQCCHMPKVSRAGGTHLRQRLRTDQDLGQAAATPSRRSRSSTQATNLTIQKLGSTPTQPPGPTDNMKELSERRSPKSGSAIY